jgi:hypothetical protein
MEPTVLASIIAERAVITAVLLIGCELMEKFVDVKTSVQLTPEEEVQLSGIFGANSLDEALTQIGKAALREYVDMFVGQNVLRSPDAREQRLLLLILEARGGQVPDQATVERWFNLSPTGARSLIRSVLSRYRLKLENALLQAAKGVLKVCAPKEKDEAFRRVSVSNPVLVEYLNSMLAQLDGRLKRIVLEPGTGTIYHVPEDSYAKLNTELKP